MEALLDESQTVPQHHSVKAVFFQAPQLFYIFIFCAINELNITLVR